MCYVILTTKRDQNFTVLSELFIECGEPAHTPEMYFIFINKIFLCSVIMIPDFPERAAGLPSDS